MMDIFPLPLFPVGSLANSVVTTVWVGVMVVGFFNLRLGWVLSGLVVPGYLAPLLIAKPWAAAAVGIEGVVTYLLVRFYSEHLMRWFGVAGFFGRDRFFAMILGSILVRIIFDGWLFPLLGAWANETFHLQFDYRYNFHSFGLIIVSLIANQFWKTGLVRGLGPFVVTLGLTWLIMRYGLMELTNFSISNLSYMYEDVAASMLASPKSYIILITTAFIASRMNLLYGWDFNGILIPSLLALQWYQPEKILVSFVEALIVLGIGILILRLPRYQGATVEGASKLMLFFNISFAWKMTLGYFLVHMFPHVKVTDYFGFGYMLPTLIAVKMHDKEIVARLIRATLQTSLTALFGATIVGFALTFLVMPFSWSVVQPLGPLTKPPEITTNKSLIATVRDEKLALYHSQHDLFTLPLPAESDLFVEGVRLLRKHVKAPKQELLEQGKEVFGKLNYHISTVEDRYLLLQEGMPRRGWGSYVFNLKAASRLVVEVPAPMEEWGAMESAVWFFEQSNGRALSIAGSKQMARADGSSNVLSSRQTPFHLFHREMASGEAVQIRAIEGANLRALTGVRDLETTATVEGQDGQVWIRGRLPEGLDLVALKQQAPKLAFKWGTPPLVNIQREDSRSGFVEIYLDRRSLGRMLLKGMQSKTAPRLVVEERRIDGYLQDWLFNSKDAIAPRGSDLYTPPTIGDLLYWDSEVLTPLISAGNNFYRNGSWTPEGLETLQAIAAATSHFGYELTRYRHKGTGADFLILSEQESKQRRYWGTYVLRLGGARDFIIQAPRPLYEGTSFEFSVHLFESMQGRWLMIGGTHPDANRDGSADLISGRTPHHLFNLVNQVILREADTAPLQVVQCRAFSARPDRPLPDADLLLAFRDGIRKRDALSPLGKILMMRLETEELKVRFVDGATGTSGYEVGLIPQARYLNATQNKSFAVLWLAPQARRGFRQQVDNHIQDARFSALGLPTELGDLSEIIGGMTIGDAQTVPDDLRHSILALQEDGDILPLNSALKRHPSFRLWRLQDLNSAQSFILATNSQDDLLLVANLDPRQPELNVPLPTGSNSAAAIKRFLDTRAALLEARGGAVP